MKSLKGVMSAINLQSSLVMADLFQKADKLSIEELGGDWQFSHKLFHFDVTPNYESGGIVYASKFLKFQCAYLQITQLRLQYLNDIKSKLTGSAKGVLYKLYVYGLWTVANELPVYGKKRGDTSTIQMGRSGTFVEESAQVRNINELCELLCNLHRNFLQMKYSDVERKIPYEGVSKILRSASETFPGIDFVAYSHKKGKRAKLLLIQITCNTEKKLKAHFFEQFSPLLEEEDIDVEFCLITDSQYLLDKFDVLKSWHIRKKPKKITEEEWKNQNELDDVTKRKWKDHIKLYLCTPDMQICKKRKGPVNWINN